MPAPKAFPQFQRAQRNTIGQLVSLPKNVSRYAHVNQFVHSQEVTYAHVELISLYLCDRRLIIRDSVEEWMLTLQQQKRGLSERTLGDDEGEGHQAEDAAENVGRPGRFSMTASDLHRLFVDGHASRFGAGAAAGSAHAPLM